jgi:hypothetical protein
MFASPEGRNAMECANGDAGVSVEGDRSMPVEDGVALNSDDRMRRTVRVPPSVLQLRAWRAARQNSSADLSVHIALRLRGRLNAQALSAALGCIVSRHESLRAAFPNVPGAPVRLINTSDVDAELIHQVIEPNLALEDYFERAATEPFNISTGPLIRFRLLRLSAEEHILIISRHKIVSVHPSNSALVNEITAVYVSARSGS